MSAIFRLSGAKQREADVDAWFAAPDELRRLAKSWFEHMRDRGPDVRELMHDGRATACVGDAAFDVTPKGTGLWRPSEVRLGLPDAQPAMVTKEGGEVVASRPEA